MMHRLRFKFGGPGNAATKQSGRTARSYARFDLDFREWVSQAFSDLHLV